MLSKLLLPASLLAATGLSADCSENVTALQNTDMNVGFVEGYYGNFHPWDMTTGLPWAYPIGHCTAINAVGTILYYKFECASEMEVTATSYGTDYTCADTSAGLVNTTMFNETWNFNCASDRTDSYLVAQMYVGACTNDASDVKNTYAALGMGMCATTLLAGDEPEPGYGNFYCDAEGMAITTYRWGDADYGCANEECAQGTVDYGSCEGIISTQVAGTNVMIFARPLECTSAQAGTCRDGTTTSCDTSMDGDDDDSAFSAAAAVVAATVSALAVAWF